MSRTSLPAWLLAGAHLSAGAFLVHAATVTARHGGATAHAVAFYAASALAAAAACSAVTGNRRPPARTRPGTAAEDLAVLATCSCDRWWTSFGTEHDAWCPNLQHRSQT
jgi:hypothetical protein